MEYQNANIYLLFCRSERQTLLQGATFYSLTMQDMGIYEFDLKNEDILGKNLREIDTSERPPVFSSLKRFFRNLFAVESDHSLTAGLQIAEKLSQVFS
jgi:hypothetical protein